MNAVAAIRNALILLLAVVALIGCARPSIPSMPFTSGSASKSLEAELPAYHWVLEEASDRYGYYNPELFAGDTDNIQLNFRDGRISVSGSCNQMGASYSIRGETLSVGDLMQTMMACERPLMVREAAIRNFLRLPLKAKLGGDEALALTLSSGDGSNLVFKGVPTAQTRFGSTGEQIFLEVQPHKAACHHAMIPDYQCLQVREVRYDSNGVQSSAGDWTYLYQEIEGFEHQAGTRYVLRVQRYMVANPRADETSIAYVLDMVVETVRVMN
ncbi:MAG: DUF4377 domain-containing protein [Pseudomonas sp.]